MRTIKGYIRKMIYKICPQLACSYFFYKKMGYIGHFKKPRTLNEKIQYLKLYVWPKNAKVIQCADKYAVRDYIKEKGYSEILVPLIGYWNKANEIDFKQLPSRFALKCNHGSGYNLICKDKKNLNIEETIGMLERWMSEDFSLYGGERHYRYIPKKIIAEKYLGEEIYDYKFFCFNGEPKFLYISVEVQSKNGKKVKCCFFDCNGEKAEFVRTDELFYADDEIPDIPEKFTEMKQIAKDLAKDFPFVRVDLFQIEEKVYFSELTFTPACGLMPLEPREWDKKLGDMLKLID